MSDAYAVKGLMFIILGFIALALFIIWLVEHNHRREEKARNEAIKQMYVALEKLGYEETVPVDAVEQLLGCLKYPHIPFDASEIIRLAKQART